MYGECISGRDGKTRDETPQKIPYAQDYLGASRTRVGGPDACIDSIAGSAYFNQEGDLPHRLRPAPPRAPLPPRPLAPSLSLSPHSSLEWT